MQDVIDTAPEKAKAKAKSKYEQYEADALALEPEALAKAPALLEQILAEYNADFAGFEFTCERYGDFLAMKLTRIARGQKIRYAGSVNIMNLKEASLLEGHPADSNGVLEYKAYMRDPHGNPVTAMHWGLENISDYPYVVEPIYPSVVSSGRTFLSGAKLPHPEFDSVEFDMCLMSWHVRHKTKNYPRAAADDRINFRGIESALYVPAGKGREVLETLTRCLAIPTQ